MSICHYPRGGSKLTFLPKDVSRPRLKQSRDTHWSERGEQYQYLQQGRRRKLMASLQEHGDEWSSLHALQGFDLVYSDTDRPHEHLSFRTLLERCSGSKALSHPW